jgi:hypothetical protein
MAKSWKTYRKLHRWPGLIISFLPLYYATTGIIWFFFPGWIKRRTQRKLESIMLNRTGRGQTSVSITLQPVRYHFLLPGPERQAGFRGLKHQPTERQRNSCPLNKAVLPLWLLEIFSSPIRADKFPS